jgi:hypothetical protein
MNREVVAGGGAGIYPLQGDVKSVAGNNSVTVVGLEGISILGSPVDGDCLTYSVRKNRWIPEGGTLSILANGVKVSFDKYVLVNGIPAIGAVLVNGILTKLGTLGLSVNGTVIN